MAHANVLDVATTLGRPITEENEQNQVLAWINGAELTIRTRLGNLDDLDPEVLRYVISESVARRVRNPEGKQNERIDDYSYGLTTEAAKASIYITDDEWALLSPTGSTSGAYFPVVDPAPWPGGHSRTQQVGGIIADDGIYA